MPTTIISLVIFVIFLTPGFISYLVRRRKGPGTPLTSLPEVAMFISTSIFIDVMTLGIFCIVRWITPKHTPDVTQLILAKRFIYIDKNIDFITLWALILLAISWILAIVAGIRPWKIGKLFTPVIVDGSTWFYLFGNAPSDSCTYVGCDLKDGSYVGGFLDWYSTDTDDNGDRDLVLATPITLKVNGKTSISEFQRLVLPERDIALLNVTFVKEKEKGKEKGHSTDHNS